MIEYIHLVAELSATFPPSASPAVMSEGNPVERRFPKCETMRLSW